MSHPIRLIILIATLPGRAGDQIDAYKRLAPIVRAEDGCLQYDMHQAADDPDRFVLIEQWASQAALDAHGVAPHMIEAAAVNPTFRAGPPQVVAFAAEPLA